MVSDSLDEAIREVYRVFATHKKPRDFDACDHCMSAEEKRFFLTRELQDLTADELMRYAADVFLTMGDVKDFKHFLPRILEISVQDDSWWPGPEVVLNKLRLADWSQWPANERNAVVKVLNEKFAALLKDPNAEGFDVDTWVCALGRCVDDLTPFLNQLENEASEETLLSFIEENQSALSNGKLANSFWDSPVNEQRLIEWLKSEKVKRLLNEKYGMIG